MYSAFYLLVVGLSLTGAISVSGHSLGNAHDAIDPKLESMGSTATKEFYITTAEAESIMSDFAYSLKHTCPNIFQMGLASVESDEEFALLDQWFMSKFENSTSSPRVWTSGVAFGVANKRWASTGAEFNLSNAIIAVPWVAGASDSPRWSWNRCLAVFKHCNRPKGAPAGCYPLRTEFIYEDCREKRQVICQRTIQQ